MFKDKVCGNCGHKGRPKKCTKGSIGMELFLWLCFIVPGVIYSLWRLGSRYECCSKCKAPNMLPLTSPIAQKLLKEEAPGKYPPTQFPYRKETEATHGNTTTQ